MDKVFIWENIIDWAKIISTSRDIWDYYTHIRMYHACKPININSYYESDIKVLNLESLKKTAINYFISDKPSTLLLKDIDEAFDYVGSDLRKGRVYSALDKRDLIEYCGHYLIYGSEFLQGVAIYLRSKYNKDYLNILKNIGTPTIFSCDIPINIIDDSYLQELNECIKKSLLINNTHIEAPHKDFAIPLYNDIDSSYIAGHFHPTSIKDPLNSFYLTKFKI